MVPKDKGWGMSNLGLWGKNPCFSTFVCLPLFLVSPNLVNLFNVLTLLVGGSYCMRKRGHGKTWVWQAVVSLDSTHAQQRTLVSLTLVFILPMVGCSHAWLVLPHAQARIVRFVPPHTLVAALPWLVHAARR